MITVSLCMIVKNEEDKLATCLDCLKDLVDEMIIVDTGSTDRTKEIAESYGAKVFDFEWTGSFSDARNYSFEQATCDFIYSADADETIDEENQERFRQLKEDIDELNSTLTKDNCEPLLCENEAFDVPSGALAFVADWKTEGTARVYIYEASSDTWYEFVEGEGNE